MRSDRPKVLHALAGKPLLAHVLDAIRALRPDRIHVVCGHAGGVLQDALPNQDITWVVQAQQLGTGHAVQQALPGIAPGAQVLVVYGDVPMLRAQTLRTLVAGALFTETIYSWPGMGSLFVDAVAARDYPMVMGIMLVTAVVVLLANLVTDLAYAVVDPRIRYE